MTTLKTQKTLAGAGIVGLAALMAVAHADDLTSEKLKNLNMNLQDSAVVALANQPGQLIEAELGYEGKQGDSERLIWEFEIVNDSRRLVLVEIDDQTGTLLKTEIDDETVPNLSEVTGFSSVVNQVRAIDSGTLIKIELEDDDGELIWEIKTMNNQNLTTKHRINALNGDLL